jgi:hypothetical protein
MHEARPIIATNAVLVEDERRVTNQIDSPLPLFPSPLAVKHPPVGVAP